jgi:cobalamin biosynthesis protein CobW
VDGVIAVVDGPAVASGRFANDPEAIARQRELDPTLDHDNPLSEVYEDQIRAADLVVLNKVDLLSEADLARTLDMIVAALPRGVKVVRAREGRLDPGVLLGLQAAAEDDLAARPSHHDAEDGEHEHDDFESFIIAMSEIEAPTGVIARLEAAAITHDILRIKGFLAVRDKPLRLEVQGVGRRFRHTFERAWRPEETRQGHLVVIGRAGLDQAAIAALIAG